MKYAVCIIVVAVLSTVAYRFRSGSTVPLPINDKITRLVHDFRVLEPSSTAVCEVPITNSSTSQWSAYSIQSACSCTVQELEPKVIAPSATGRLKVTFRASELTGPFTRDILVRFQEPDAPLVVVGLRGTVRRWAEPRPSVIDCGRVAPGTNKQVRFEIAEYEPSGTRLSKVGPDWVLLGPHLQTDIMSDIPKGIVSASSLTVRPPKDQPLGPFEGIVKITDLGADRTIDVPFRGELAAPIKAEPDQLFLGFMAPESTVERVIRLKLFDDLASISTDSLDFKHSMGAELSVAARSTEAPGDFELTATYKAPKGIGPLTGSLNIMANGVTVLTIAVRGFVRESQHD